MTAVTLSPGSPSAYSSPFENVFLGAPPPSSLPAMPAANPIGSPAPASGSSAVASPSSSAFGRSMATLVSTFKYHTADRTPSSASSSAVDRPGVSSPRLGFFGSEPSSSPRLGLATTSASTTMAAPFAASDSLGGPGYDFVSYGGPSSVPQQAGPGAAPDSAGASNEEVSLPALNGPGGSGILENPFSFAGLAKPAYYDSMDPNRPGSTDQIHWDGGGFRMDYGELNSAASIMNRHEQAFEAQPPYSAAPMAVSPAAMSPSVSPGSISPRPSLSDLPGASRNGSDTSLAGRKRHHEEMHDPSVPPPADEGDDDGRPAGPLPFRVPQLSFSDMFSHAQDRKDEWDDDDLDQDPSGLLADRSRNSVSPSLSPHLMASGSGSIDGTSRSGSRSPVSPGSISPKLIEGNVHTNIAFPGGHKKSVSQSAIQKPGGMADILPRTGSGGPYTVSGPRMSVRRNSSLSILTSQMALQTPSQREHAFLSQLPAQIQMPQADTPITRLANEVTRATSTAMSVAEAAAVSHHHPSAAAPLQPSLQLILGDFIESLNHAQAEERGFVGQSLNGNALAHEIAAQQQQQQQQQQHAHHHQRQLSHGNPNGVQYSANMFLEDPSLNSSLILGQQNMFAAAAANQVAGGQNMVYAQVGGALVSVPVVQQQQQGAAQYGMVQQQQQAMQSGVLSGTSAQGEQIIMVPYRTDSVGNMFPIGSGSRTSGVLGANAGESQVDPDPYGQGYNTTYTGVQGSNYQPPNIIQLPNGQLAQLTTSVPQNSSMLLVPTMGGSSQDFQPSAQAASPAPSPSQAQALYQGSGTSQQLYGLAVPSPVPLTTDALEGHGASMYPKAQQPQNGSRITPYTLARAQTHHGAREVSPGPPVEALVTALEAARRSVSPQPGPPPSLSQRSYSLPSDLTQAREYEPNPEQPRKRNKPLPRGISTQHRSQSLSSAPPIVLPPDHNPMAAATTIVANRKPVPITGPAPPGATSGPAGTHTPSGKAKNFKCELCPQTFSRSHDLKRHVGIHTGVRAFQCERCGRSFSRRDALNKHHRAGDTCADDVDEEEVQGYTTAPGQAVY